MAFEIGDTIGDYQVIGILGAGGMGKVYKVRNVISDRVEAMKVLLPDLAHEPELADRFMREIKLLASLNHPNIAALHTAQRYENQLLMIMEFVEGRTLEQRLKESGRLGVREAVECISQTLAALGYAHERGVVHRDIKPANMMETPDGGVKLMDFGIAKAAADRRLTMTGTTLGSLYYMSPEQVKGSGNLDGRSDVYSVGVSLYELVTGTRPFKGDSDYSIMVAHLEQLPVPPIQIDPSLPPALSEIILGAIQKDAGERFQTAQAFRSALESVKALLPEVLPGPGSWNAAPMPAAPHAAPMSGVPTQPQSAAAPTWPQQQAAPQPAPIAQPMPQAVPPQAAWQQAPPPVAPAAQGKSHRGLWMSLGALVAVGVLAFAAFQVPKFFGTKADTATQQPAAQSEAAATEPMPQSAVPAEQTSVPVPAESASQTQAAPVQAESPVPAASKPASASGIAAFSPRVKTSRTASPGGSFAPAPSQQPVPAASGQQEVSAPQQAAAPV
ncbi:MAG TPA: protein kinase, partial [Bryobacteraceae bacterium]|nr:protein kinase [Bryobacteraceae bacterium]